MRNMERLNELFSGADIAKMRELEERVKAIDLDSLRSDPAKLAMGIREGKAIGRKIKKLKERKKPRQSRATKLRKKREYRQKVVSPKLRELRAEMWESGDTWGIVTKNWESQGLKPEIDQQEWMEYVHPQIVGSVFTLNRYDRTVGWSLDNIYVVDTKRTVLWDGKEHQLRKLGYII